MSGKSKNIFARFHDYIGGAFGWVGIGVGSLFVGGGIAALLLKASTSTASTAVIATTTLTSTVALGATLGLALGIVGIVIGAAIILAILLFPVYKRNVTKKKTDEARALIIGDENGGLTEQLRRAGEEQRRLLESPRVIIQAPQGDSTKEGKLNIDLGEFDPTNRKETGGIRV